MSRAGTRHWRTLSALYLERSRRAMIVISVTSLPLALLFAQKSGFRFEEVVVNLTLVAALWPMAAGGVVGKCKADGSLAFLASLPVSRTDHARSWLAVIGLLSIPLSLAVAVACHVGPLQLRGLELLAASASAGAVATTVVMTLVAMQLSAPPTTAVLLFMKGMTIIVTLVAGLGHVVSWFPAQFDALSRSHLLVPVLSLLSWSLAVVAFWWSWRRIGYYMTSYVGEPPEA